MYFAVSSWGLRDLVNKQFPLSQMALEVKNRFGIDAVELCQQHFLRQDAVYLNGIVKGLTQAGSKCVNMPIDVGNISNPHRQEREHDLEIIKGWFRVAAYIGCPMVRVNTGNAPDAAAMDRAVESYKQLAEAAAALGLKLVLENHGGLSSDPANVMKLLDRVGRDKLGLCPDFGNYEEGKRYTGIAAMMPAALIVHAKYNQPDAGGAAWDWPRCVRIVKASGFDGPVSLEIGRYTDPWAAIAEAHQLWRESWQVVE